MLTNGLGGDIHAWHHFVTHFAPSTRIISWDYRGLYASSTLGQRTSVTMPHHLEDMVAVIGAARCEKIVLVGWSMGVQLNFEWMRNYGDRVNGIIAINGTAGTPFRTAFQTDLVERHIPQAFEFIRKYWQKAAPWGARLAGSQAFLRSLQLLGLVGHTLKSNDFMDLAKAFAKLDFGVYSDILESVGNHSAHDVLPTINVPTLIMAGQHDLFTPVTTAREMSEAITDAELYVVPGGTHYCPLEFPELTNLRIEKFLRDRLGWNIE
ncbi:MAG: alpha/beta hydrolase [Myxococcales bacterium]|nr:alpha/beta hydrolase [Myxococcales bacterium]